MSHRLACLVIALLVLVTPALQAAENCYLQLHLNGVEIEGESTQTSLGRADKIECVSFTSGFAKDDRNRPVLQTITIRKRIDKSTPLLHKGLGQNEVATGIFRFYRPSPVGDGTTEQYYTIEFTASRVHAIEQVSPDSLSSETTFYPMYEDVTFAVTSVTWTYENGGVTYQYDSVATVEDSDLIIVK